MGVEVVDVRSRTDTGRQSVADRHVSLVDCCCCDYSCYVPWMLWIVSSVAVVVVVVVVVASHGQASACHQHVSFLLEWLLRWVLTSSLCSDSHLLSKRTVVDL